MSETTTVKPNFIKKTVAAVRKHERKILVATTVTSTGLAIFMHSNVGNINTFLKEKGLFDEYYGMNELIEN